MNRLQEIKEEYAKHYAFNSWEELSQSVDSTSQLNEAVGDIARMYAEECIRASLEKASEKAINERTEYAEEDDYFFDYLLPLAVTDKNNIVLL